MPPDRDPSVAPTRPKSAAPPLHRRYRLRLPRVAEAVPGLYPGEPVTCRRDWKQFAAIFAHLGLLMRVVQVYHIEGRGLQIVVGLAMAALPIHYALPFAWKRPAFLALSIVGLAWVFGPATALVVLAVSAALIGACLAPLSWKVRASIVAAVGFGLCLGRAGHLGAISAAVPSAAWPVIGSMFMFRMILYLYELKHAEGRPSPLDAASYFCLLPNFAFLHFPVVDFRALRRGYFSTDVHDLQRTGLRMMVRGVTHLLIYRVLDLRYFIPAEEVHNPATLLAHIACNYLKYLHVSGQFHLACGLLHLFGFGLPETHHDYLLATGFTDYWRRINIYWKDFMIRVVFNPVAFRLKSRPPALALGAATACVFVTTWLLHAFQSFWLRGTWGFGLPDALFWGILGVLVLVNVQLDARSRRRKPEPSRRWASATTRLAKVLGTFATIALLWSLWSSPSVSAWLAMLRRGMG